MTQDISTDDLWLDGLSLRFDFLPSADLRQAKI